MLLCLGVIGFYRRKWSIICRITSAPSICIISSLTCNMYIMVLGSFRNTEIYGVNFHFPRSFFFFSLHMSTDETIIIPKRWLAFSYQITKKHNTAVRTNGCMHEGRMRETWITLWAANLCRLAWKLTSTFSHDTRDKPATSSSAQKKPINKLLKLISSNCGGRKFPKQEEVLIRQVGQGN